MDTEEGKEKPPRVFFSSNMAKDSKNFTICSLGGGTLRPPNDLRATEEEGRGMMKSRLIDDNHYDGARLNPKGGLESDVVDEIGTSILKTKAKALMKIGSWNVRTLMKRGSLENAKREMKRMGMNILGLCEVRWKGAGDFMSEDVRVIYSGGMESQRGVAVLLNKEMGNRVTKVIQHSDRLMLVKIQAEPVNLVIIQVYMPTSDHSEEEVEELYEEMEVLIEKEKGNDYLVVMGDWNAVVGEGKDDKEVGSFGLGKRNERGQLLVEFCKRKKMKITNTWFDHEKRRIYTWKKAGDTGRYQLDYILVRQRYGNSVKNSRGYPGADIDSDHNLVMMNAEIKLKKMKRAARRYRWKLEGLEQKADAFQKQVSQMLNEGYKGEMESIEDDWKEFKGIVKKSAEDTIGYQKARKAKKPWISEGMIEKMDERRKWKNVNNDEGRKKYRKLNNGLRRETERAREKWWKEECEELEILEKKGRSDLMYAKVKQITRTGKKGASYNFAIQDKSGFLLNDPDKVRKRWQEYIEELYGTCDKPKIEEFGLEQEGNVEEDDKGPELLVDEIRVAIKEMKNKKAEGIDGIPAEILKILGVEANKRLEEICRKIYAKGIWPEDFTRVVMIPLKKKENATDCADHRTISLISHASKIVLRIVVNRIEAKAKNFIGRNQFGFRKSCGTRDAIGVVRMLCERSLGMNQDVYICFVDFEKAFDRVKWIKMLELLKRIGVDWRDRRLICNLYMEQTAAVRVADECSDYSKVGRGVRQGCCLSPLLFNVYTEMMMLEAIEDVEEGVKVGGKLVKDVRFADDQGMVANSELGLQKLMDGVVRAAEEYGMKVNGKKTKAMRISRRGIGEVKIFIEGQKVEQVKRFKYLGSIISDDGRCDAEIKARIGIAKDVFSKRKELLTQKMSRSVKKKIVKTVVWSAALYGAETWTLRKDDMRRLNALEMWLWRRMERISWVDKKTNREVLTVVGEERQLVNAIVKRKKNWLGHVMRGDGLLRDVMEGMMECRKPKGRPRIGMLEELKEGSYGDMKRRAENRYDWRCWMPRTCREAEYS